MEVLSPVIAANVFSKGSSATISLILTFTDAVTKSFSKDSLAADSWVLLFVSILEVLFGDNSKDVLSGDPKLLFPYTWDLFVSLILFSLKRGCFLLIDFEFKASSE